MKDSPRNVFCSSILLILRKWNNLLLFICIILTIQKDSFFPGRSQQSKGIKLKETKVIQYWRNWAVDPIYQVRELCALIRHNKSGSKT